MFFVLSKILDLFASPFFWILISFILGMYVSNPKRKKRLLWISLSMLLIFSNPFLVNRIMRAWEIPSRNASTIREPYDVGIVLGGSMRYYDQTNNRVVYSSSVDRLLQALQLYHDGHIRKILLTGGSGFVNFQEWKESGLIADVLLKSGVKPEDILLENNSRNTYENATMSANLLQNANYGNRFLLITSAFHMRRSLACFRKAGLNVDAFPVDPRAGFPMNTLDQLIQPNAENIDTWETLNHEWLGMLMYKLMGYI
jgi:uncharacterized SAM-binding protein YcdF (DUF218 family)